MADEIQTVRLPDLGEGLTEARIDRYLVEVGQRVSRLDSVAEVETDKATVELTTPYSGTVVELVAAEDAWVPVGEAVLTIRADNAD